MEYIDNIIINRLGERQRKVDFINKNIRRRNGMNYSFRRIGYTMVSVAACAVIIFVMSPILFKSHSISDTPMATPSFTEHRGTGNNEIESLLSSEKNQEALLVVNRELDELKREIQSLPLSEMSEEEKRYTTDLYEGKLEELLWCKIYLLVKLDRKDDLRDACRNYLINSNFSLHKTEVESIMERIN